MRLPYETIIIEADRLMMLMASTQDEQEAFNWFHFYIEFLESCGWTDQEFDQEILRRIDEAW